MSRRTSEPCSKRGIEPCQLPINISIRRSCGSLSTAYLTNSGPGYELIPLIAFFVPLEGGGVCAVARDNKVKTSVPTVRQASAVRFMNAVSFLFFLATSWFRADGSGRNKEI